MRGVSGDAVERLLLNNGCIDSERVYSLPQETLLVLASVVKLGSVVDNIQPLPSVPDFSPLAGGMEQPHSAKSSIRQHPVSCRIDGRFDRLLRWKLSFTDR